MTPALLVLLVTVTPTAPVPKGATPSPLYYPTKVGAKWVYDRGADDAEEELVVTGVETVGDEWVVSRKRSKGPVTTHMPVTVSAAGLRQPASKNDPGRLVTLLDVEARPGDSWDVPDGKRTFVGFEEVTVAAGRYRAAKVTLDVPDGQQATFWYALGIGEVKKVRRDKNGRETVVRSLKSFTPGK